MSSLRLALKASLVDVNLGGNRQSSMMSPPLSSLNLPHLSCSGEQKVEAEVAISAASIISSPTSVSKSSSSSSSSSSSGNNKCESSLADRRTNSNNNGKGKISSNNASISTDNTVEVEAPTLDSKVATKYIASTTAVHPISKQTVTTQIPKIIATVAAAPASSSSNSLSSSSFPKETSSNPTPTTTTATTTTTQRGYVSPPMIYVTITLQRNPNKVQSWGIVFTKEKYATLAYIIRVTRPPPTTSSSSSDNDGGPNVTHCQITNSTQYTFDKQMYTKYILPGDGIYSINGINLSSFTTTAELASYIHTECTTQITFVIMRHESVWRAVTKCHNRMQQMQIKLNNKRNNNDNNDNTTNDNDNGMVECVSKSVNNAWRWVLAPISNNSSSSSSSSSNAGQQQIYSLTTSNSCKYTAASINRPTTTNTTNTAMKRPREDEIEVIDNGEDTTVIHNFWIVNGYATFSAWHEATKSKWVQSYSWNKDKINFDEEGESNAVVHDFWLVNDKYDSFHSWHATSKAKWARSYTWHKIRRDDFQMKCEKEVHFPTVATAATAGDATSAHTGSNNTLVKFENWLGVRKNQWKVERRKRQRLLRAVDTAAPQTTTTTNSSSTISINVNNNNNNNKMQSTTSFGVNVNDMYIDDMLQDQEQLDGRASYNSYHHQPIDILWIFDSQLGAPDDVIANLMTYLNPCDHGSLLCLSSTTNTLFKQRNDMWRTLFPSHWIVPRRPRQTWCTMYITKIRAEERIVRKRSETILLKANIIIDKGDQLHKLDKLICKAIQDFDFSINYTSGVVLECNSILNLSVIARRHKITKWLIETMGADVETFDRGRFTPLMNAAWNGDRYITRYLLSKKCDRTKIGYYHSSKGIAPPSFEGLTAEGWACNRGHDDVAELIHLGL